MSRAVAGIKSKKFPEGNFCLSGAEPLKSIYAGMPESERMRLAFSSFFLKRIVLLRASSFLSMVTDNLLAGFLLRAVLCFAFFISDTNMRKNYFWLSSPRLQVAPAGLNFDIPNWNIEFGITDTRGITEKMAFHNEDKN